MQSILDDFVGQFPLFLINYGTDMCNNYNSVMRMILCSEKIPLGQNYSTIFAKFVVYCMFGELLVFHNETQYLTNQ